jgi:hypothetical protein
VVNKPGTPAVAFFAPSRTRLHRTSQPVPLTKVETKKSPNPPWKHHRQKDRGGVQPINHGSKPQLSSNLYIGCLSIPCTHLVHFSVFVNRRRISARWTPLAEDTLHGIIYYSTAIVICRIHKFWTPTVQTLSVEKNLRNRSVTNTLHHRPINTSISSNISELVKLFHPIGEKYLLLG